MFKRTEGASWGCTAGHLQVCNECKLALHETKKRCRMMQNDASKADVDGLYSVDCSCWVSRGMRPAGH